MLQLQTEDALIQIASIKTYVILFRKEMINEKNYKSYFSRFNRNEDSTLYCLTISKQI